jgi:hypothetical protein
LGYPAVNRSGITTVGIGGYRHWWDHAHGIKTEGNGFIGQVHTTTIQQASVDGKLVLAEAKKPHQYKGEDKNVF